MRLGSFVIRLFSLRRLLGLSAILILPASQLAAQSPWHQGGKPAAQAAAQETASPPAGGAVQAVYLSPNSGMFANQQTPYMDAHGNPLVVPVNHGEPIAGYGCPPGYGGSPGYDLASDVATDMYGVDNRGPHFFDVRAEYVTMTRDESFGQQIDFTSFNIGTTDIVLSSEDLELDYEPGFRIVGRYDLGPMSVVEFGYMGIYDWKSGNSFTDPNPVDGDTGNLFSLFSEFGTNPLDVTDADTGPMPESERSITQSISLDVDLHTAEMSYRRYWVGYIPRISGTILAGVRYTRLKESFEFNATGEASLAYLTKAENDLTGFQTGGDIWVALMQGVRIGAEGKVGIYNNNYVLDNLVITNPEAGSPPDLNERFSSNNGAFISDASIDLIVDILPSWSLRAGYEVLFINSLVLAGENFNTTSPYELPGQAVREPFLFDQGHALMHGGHVGVEFVW